MPAKDVVATLCKPAAARPAANRLATMSRRHRVETIGRLAGGVAHDINNLLTAIMLNSDALSESVTEAKLRTLADTTRMSAERAGDLTRHLLAFVRGERLPPRPTDVNATIVAFAPLLRRILGGQIDLEVVTEARRATVMLEPGQFEPAILNLALNARDAMPRGGRVAIRTGNAADLGSKRHRAEGDSDAGAVIVAVSDNGPGMSPTVLARASEPFFTTKEAGTGLGLSIVQAFVRQAGGRFRVDSHRGAGTTVTLLLPLSKTEPKPSQALPFVDPWAELRGGESILLVDDDRLARAHVDVALTDLGYRVCVAADSSAALDAFSRSCAFDLLLTNVTSPGQMSGVELAALLQRSRPSLHVLYTSAHGVSPKQAAMLERRPHSAVLAKPFRRRELAAAVRALFDAPVGLESPPIDRPRRA